jgi:hypothetical protein
MRRALTLFIWIIVPGVILGAAFYLMCIEPTSNAKLLREDFEFGHFPLEYFLHELPMQPPTVPIKPKGRVTESHLLPLTWKDYLNKRRRLVATIDWSDEKNPQFHVIDEIEMSADFPRFSPILRSRTAK